MEILKCYRVSAVYGEMFIVLFMSMGLVSFGTSAYGFIINLEVKKSFLHCYGEISA